MAAPQNEIGACSCPICDSTRARLRFSSKGLAYVTCNACNSQAFARSDRSDELLRGRHAADPQPDPEPVRTAVAAAPVATVPVRTDEPAAPVHTKPPPSLSWGAASWNA